MSPKISNTSPYIKAVLKKNGQSFKISGYQSEIEKYFSDYEIIILDTKLSTGNGLDK